VPFCGHLNHSKDNTLTLYSAIGLTVAILILAASPGPGVMATVARALSSGFRPAAAVIAGIVLGDIIFLLLATFGLSVVAHVLGDLFFLVKVCGGAYLVWLGFKIWTSNTGGNESLKVNGPRTGWGNFSGGLLITLSNPKVILFYCGFLPTFLDLSALTPLDLTAIVLIVTTVVSGVLATYAFLASRARRLFTSSKAARRLNRAAGGVMVATGIVIATRP